MDSENTHQCTIKNSFSINGKGVHQNRNCKITFYPAQINSGIQFLTRYQGQIKKLKAHINTVSQKDFQLSLSQDSFSVDTVEHLLSALYALNITNCLIEIEGPEIPFLDGSSIPFVNKILQVGIQNQNTPLKNHNLPSPIAICHKNKYIYARPNERLIIHTIIEFDHPLIRKQSYRFVYNKKSYIKEISKARTFGFLSDWEQLKKKGYALGSSVDNTIVYDSKSILNPPLRFPDECVRHKVLDFIASLSLLSYRVTGEFFCYCSGHTLDIDFIKILDQAIHNNKKQPSKLKANIEIAKELVQKHFSCTVE